MRWWELARIHQALVRQAFRYFYHEFAWTYDTVAWVVSRGLWKHWILAGLPFVEGRVLELGCGTGYMQHALAAHHPAPAIGVDASRQMLAHTRRRARRDGCHITLVRAGAEALPFQAGNFQTVLATFPSEYIIQPTTLREVARVLAPTGRLVIVDAPRFGNDGIYERAIDLAYRLTFQRSVVRSAPVMSPFEPFLNQAGFAFTTTHVPVGSSQTLPG
jgi:ubiquinone/menaquinone biosynthesis C-methylase UbiE